MITFNIKQGGLGRRLPGKDHVCGIVFPIADVDLPAGFAVDDRVKKIESIDEAETLGIVDSGTGAVLDVLHYHLTEFFLIFEQKAQSIGEVWVHLVSDAAAIDEDDITALQTAANGDIRQFYVWNADPFAASMTAAAGTAAATMLSDKVPSVVIVGADFSGDAVADLDDARGLDTPWVGLDMGQDYSTGSQAASIAENYSGSIGSGGAILGLLAAISVSTNIGYVRDLNIADSVRWQNPGLANGSKFSELTAAEVASLVTKGLIFPRPRAGVNGCWFNDSPLAVAADNDFAFIENARTIQKAIRVVNEKLIPFINSPISVNASTGKLSEAKIFQLESACFEGLNQMGADLEISVDEETGRLPNNAVFIDPDQNVLSTSLINITVRIVPIGVQRQTVINIGFAPKLNTVA